MPDDAKRAVFLSYASLDAEAAKRICVALRAAGIEVWFDQSELVGGDAWDAKIRGQIGDCVLFIPLVSANTQARREGYFRLEWKLADERTHLMAEGTPFILPVTIDASNERGALVPKSFLAVQWTKLPGGETTAAFGERVRSLLSGVSAMEAGKPAQAGKTSPVQRDEGVASPVQVGRALRARRIAFAFAVAILVTVVGWWIVHSRSPTATTAEAAARRSAPPTSEISAAAKPPLDLAAAKSIAVLPFENLSPEKADEIFADGMHDEVISALTKIRDLTVIARSSVLGYRKIEGRNLRQIAAELKVAHVLEGRVRRMGSQIKVTVELIEVGTGKLLWANPYTEELTNAFTIQSKLADAITTALKATFSPEEKSRIDRQFTKDPVAYELFL
ncbi:MAG: TIR domain-containing protein [Opitutus sp.]|nr:TIR domain-containing protein [Opitutus sp.]